MNKVTLAGFLGSACLFSCSNARQKNDNERPNILLIVLDDMGYSDIQPFGGEINTPNINKLAEDGICFTGFHTSSLSAPTRAMLLTGADNHQNGFGAMPPLHADNQYLKDGYEGYLNNRVITLAEILRDNQYYTCMSGKWHLGAGEGKSPYERGFDNSFAMMGGGSGYFSNPFPECDADIPVTFYKENDRRIEELPDDFYSTRYFTDKIIEYINKCPDDKPFFGYYALTAPHDPLHVLPDWKEKYHGKYDCGYDSIHTMRINRQKEIGIIPQSTSVDNLSGMYPKWADLNQQQKKEQSRRMELYAAMLEYADFSIGRVINELERLGKLDNTLIIFMSDNGANPKEPEFYPGNTKELISSRFNNSLDNYGNSDSFVTLGGAWAEICSTPYSLYKMTTCEGGICTPLIISGKGVKMKNSIDTKSLIHVTDLYPTIMDYSGTTYPDIKDGTKTAPMYGKSLKNLLTSKDSVARGDEDVLCFEINEDKAVIKGEWKAVNLNKPYGDGKTWKLYKYREDISEKHNLAEKNKEKLDELLKEWDKYATSVGYIPSDGSMTIKRIGAEQFYKFGK